MKKFCVKKGENGEKYLENATKMDIIFGQKNRQKIEKMVKSFQTFWTIFGLEINYPFGRIFDHFLDFFEIFLTISIF